MIGVLFLSLWGISHAYASEKPKLDAKSLWQYAQTHHIDSVEGLLTALPSSMKHSYILVYGGQAFQESSIESPRILLRGPFSKFVLAFNGDPKQRAYNSAEIVQFNEKESRFEYYSLDFPLSAKPPEKNPTHCLGCHGADPHPIWDGYPLWPGSLGSEEGSTKYHPEEQKIFSDFLKKKGAHPRYSWLDDAIVANNRLPLQYLETNNASFGKDLQELNSRRVYRKLHGRGTVDLPKSPYRFAVLAHALCDVDSNALSQDVESKFVHRVVPEALLKTFAKTPEQFLAELEDQNYQFYMRRVERERQNVSDLQSQRLKDLITDPESGGSDYVFGMPVFYLLTQMGVDLSDWGLNFPRTSYAFNYGVNPDFLGLFRGLYQQIRSSSNADDRTFVKLVRDLRGGKLPTIEFLVMGIDESSGAGFEARKKICEATEDLSLTVLSKEGK